MLIANVLQQLYNVVDSVVVGKFVSKEALAAVGSSFPVIFVMISLLVGISTGITVIISQFYGAKQFENVTKSINTFFVFIFFSSIIISFFGIYFSREIFELLKLPPDIVTSAVDYLQIYLAGLLFMFGFYGTMAILRGLGDSKTPLYFVIFSTFLNIGLDLLFVLVFGWAVKGVAYATVLAHIITFIAITIYINRTNSLIHFSIKNLTFDKEIFIKSMKIGLPTGLQQSFVALGLMAVMRIVNDFGTDAIAGFTAASRLDSFATMPAMAIAAALSTFVGQNIGANKIERVRRGYIITLIFSATISVIVSLSIYFFGKPMLSMFTTDANVIEIGYQYLVIVSSFYILFSSMFINNALLRGAGDTLVPMIISFIALWILRIPISYFLSRESLGLGTTGIWWGVPIGWLFGFLASYAYYKTGRWKRKKIISIVEQPEVIEA